MSSVDTTARALETTFQAAISAALPVPVYRADESIDREYPCVILSAQTTGEDEAFIFSGRYAQEVTLRAAVIVAGNPADNARQCDLLAAQVKTAIETASIPSGWNYLRLEYDGDERGFEDARRTRTHVYICVAHEA